MGYLSYIMESSLVLGVGYGYYQAFLRKETRFQLHRVYLLAILAMGLLLPLVKVELAFLEAPLLETVNVALQEVVIWASPEQGIEGVSGIWLVYWLGVSWMGGKLVWRISRILQLIRGHQRRKEAESILVLTSDQVPVSSFLHYIFWHEVEHLTSEQRAQLLIHERCHVQEKHSWDVLLIELLLIFFWFQPFLYLLQRSIQQNHEFIADQASLQHSSVRSYTQLILTQLFGQQLSLVHSFFHPPVTMRVIMLKKQQSSRRANWKYAALIPLFVGLTFALSCTPDLEQSEAEVLAQVAPATPDAKAQSEVDQYPKPLNLAAIQQEIGYPKAASAQNLEGKVLIKVLVDKSGSYVRHEVLESPDEVFTDAIEQHIQKLKFEPAKKDDKQVKFWVSIPFNFKLS